MFLQLSFSYLTWKEVLSSNSQNMFSLYSFISKDEGTFDPDKNEFLSFHHSALSKALNLSLLQGDWTCNLTCRCCVKVTAGFNCVVTIEIGKGKALRFVPVERIFWWRSCSFWRRCCRRAWWLLLTLVSMATDRGIGPRSWVDKPCMTADTPPPSTCLSWSPKAAWEVIERYYIDLSWLNNRLEEDYRFISKSVFCQHKEWDTLLDCHYFT